MLKRQFKAKSKKIARNLRNKKRKQHKLVSRWFALKAQETSDDNNNQNVAKHN